MRAIIIGAGSMGSWFARFLSKEGWEVDLLDVSHEKAVKASEEVGGRAVSSPEGFYNLALIAVPISETPKALLTYRHRAEVLVEIASVKGKVIKVVREEGIENVLSIHPLFGPGLKDPRDGKAVLIPIHDADKELRFAKSVFPFDFIVRDVSTHDRVMAWLAISHGILNSLLAATEGMSEHLSEMSTTTVRGMLTLAGASLLQSPILTEELVKENLFFQEEFNKFLKELTSFSEDPSKVINKVRRWRNLLDTEKCYSALYRMLKEL